VNPQEQALPATKRKWNWRIWTGFVVAIIAIVSYLAIFIRFPITRDVPWANWLLFGLAAWLLVGGLRRAFGRPETYRGKIAGPILAILSLGLAGFFGWGTLHATRILPPSTGAPRVGTKAPEFTLADASGHMIALSTLLSEPLPGRQGAGPNPRGVVLIFYRGYW
jgi:hypothetical protein